MGVYAGDGVSGSRTGSRTRATRSSSRNTGDIFELESVFIQRSVQVGIEVMSGNLKVGETHVVIQIVGG